MRVVASSRPRNQGTLRFVLFAGMAIGLGGCGTVASLWRWER